MWIYAFARARWGRPGKVSGMRIIPTDGSADTLHARPRRTQAVMEAINAHAPDFYGVSILSL